MAIQLIDARGLAIINGLVRELQRRNTKDLPMGEFIRSFVMHLEKELPAIAKLVHDHDLWERFQQKFNEPDRDRRRLYGMACRDVFEQAILDALFTFGYTEEMEDGYKLFAKKNEGYIGYTVSLRGPDDEDLKVAKITFPMDVLGAMDTLSLTFEK